MARTPEPSAVRTESRSALGRTFIGLAVISLLSVVTLSVLLVHLQDRNAAQASRNLVESALATRTEKQNTLIVEYGYWDKAVDHLVKPPEPDRGWFDSEFGEYLYSQVGVQIVRIIDGDGNEKIRAIEGIFPDPMVAIPLPASEVFLIAEARKSPDNEQPVPVSAYTLNDGQVYLSTAVRMTTYDDEDDISTDHVLLFSRALNEEFLTAIEKASLVRGLTVAERGEMSGETSSPLPIAGHDGALMLLWRSDLPGTAMIPWMLTGLGAFVLVLIVAGMLFMRRMAKHAEALEQARQISEQASRQKSEFLANMSHELRTPLNAVIGFADIMRNQYLGPVGNVRYLEYATDIRNSGEHLLSLVNGLLDMSKIEAGHYEMDLASVDVADITRQSTKMVELLAKEKSIAIATEIPDALPNIRADERALRQVLVNLMSNAVKFTPDGGRVSIAAQVRDDSRVDIRVSDSGVGIPAKDIDLILEPFYQVKSTPEGGQRGTGLGLSVSRKLVELMGGRLRIESTVGLGTLVTISLNAGAARAENSEDETDRHCA